MTKTSTYDKNDALTYISNYVPYRPGVPEDVWIHIESRVREIGAEVIEASDSPEKGLEITDENVRVTMHVLARHCATVFRHTGSLPDNEELFSDDVMHFSAEHSWKYTSTRNRNHRKLQHLAITLGARKTGTITAYPLHIRTEAYTQDELHEILRTIHSQTTEYRQKMSIILVSLALSGLDVHQILQAKNEDIHTDHPVHVRADGHCFYLPSCLVEDFLESVDQSSKDNYLFKTSCRREEATIFDLTNRMNRGPDCPPVSVRRLRATWFFNLAKHGIAGPAMESTFGISRQVMYQYVRANPPQPDIVAQLSRELTDRLLGDADGEFFITPPSPSTPDSAHSSNPGLTLIDGGLMP